MTRRLRLSLVLGGLALAAVALPARAQSPAPRPDLTAAVRAFDEGNARYAEGDYRAAVAAYERALTAGYESGALYYNLGNAHYRLDQIGRAVLSYERARRLLPDDPRLQHNLSIVATRTVDQFSSLPAPVWTRAWHRFARRAGARLLFGVGLAFYLAGAGLVAHRIWTGHRGDWTRRGLTAALGLGLLLVTLAFGVSLSHSQLRTAVVVAPSAELRTAPAPDAQAELTVHEGLVAAVVQARGEWVEVRLPNGATGWLPAGTIAEV